MEKNIIIIRLVGYIEWDESVCWWFLDKNSGSVNFLSAVQVLYLSFLLIDSHAYAMLMFAVASNI